MLSSSVAPVLYFAACFFYVLWKLDPRLYYQCQVPPFLWDDAFLQKFLTFPGGLSEYLSNLISQFYYFPVPGALIVTGCLAATLGLARAFAKEIAPAWKNSLLTFLPSILLLMMFSQYEHRLTYTIAFLLALAFALLYLTLKTKAVAFRFGAFFLLSVGLYYVAAGFFLLFALLAILVEILYQRNRQLGALYLVLAILLPYIAFKYLFILTPISAYFYLLLPIYEYRPVVTPFLLYLYFPLLFILARTKVFSRMDALANRFDKKLQISLLFGLTIFAAVFSFDATMRTVLKVDYFARQRQWQRLLAFVDKHPSDDLLVAFQTNRALFHTGRLATDMFSYNQSWGVDGLFLPEEARKFFSIQISDFYWDMGFLNEAQHWVLEDHSNFDYSPWHLQRLALISILRGNKNLAEMCLQTLDKTFLYRGWAAEHRPLLSDSLLVEKDPQLAHLKRLRVAQDFIINSRFPEQDVHTIVAQNAANDMAFEYLMANYMLTFRLGVLVADLQASGYFDAANLPKLYQQAVLVFLQNTGWQNGATVGRGINRQTINEFNGFLQILSRHEGNATAARDELGKEYGHTYWYYSLFNNPNARLAAP